MTAATTFLALAERCEQAAGPDAGLDLAIWKALSEMPGFKHPSPIWRFDVTGSLDAAVTLVPEGWTWARFNSGAVECMTLNGPGGSILFERGQGTSTALALCAAALRARAAML
jgi:hypothetical protein